MLTLSGQSPALWNADNPRCQVICDVTRYAGLDIRLCCCDIVGKMTDLPRLISNRPKATVELVTTLGHAHTVPCSDSDFEALLAIRHKD